MDFTRLSTFQCCPERFRLRYVASLRKIKEDAYEAPTKFGQALHIALAEYYKGHTIQEAQEAFLVAYPEAIDPMDLARTPPHGVITLGQYADYYALQDQQWKIQAVEITDKVELAPGVEWEVKLDLIVETQGGIWGVDHKSTSKPFTEQYWRQYEPNSQLSGYTYYLQQQYGQCSGMIINGIQVGYRKRAYKGEEAGFHCSFQRQIFNRTPRQLEDWREYTLLSLARLEATKQSGAWEKNETQCVFCEYNELCRSCNDDQISELLYEKVDTLAYLHGVSEPGGN